MNEILNEKRGKRLMRLLKEAYQLGDVTGNCLRILLIGDSFAKRQAIIRKLAGLPVRVFDCDSGVAGIDLFREQVFDFVLLDVSMPKMNGFQVCRKLRALNRGVEAPIVLLATDATVENIMKTKEAGADDFIVKPITKEMLISKIQSNIVKYNISWSIDIIAEDSAG